MKIGYVVGALVRGGAELQVLRLAAGLVARGHEVHVFAYGGPSALDDDFRSAGVTVVAERLETRAQKVRSVRGWMRRLDLDVAHAVLKRASTVSLLARWAARRPAVVVTDYSSATYGRRGVFFWSSLVAFAWADRVVTEIDLNRASLERLAPWLRGKVEVVRNGLDTDRFAPDGAAAQHRGGPFTFCVVATVSTVKNPLRVIDAAAELRRRGHTDFRVSWYGRDGVRQGQNIGERARVHAAARGVADRVVFHGDTPQIERAYLSADALLHASVHEGFPNVVAEGMACGLPIAVSRVSDLPRIVAEARNGFVFDETDPSAIADAMERLMALPPDERAAMGARSRELAVRWFRAERFIDAFEDLYRTLSTGRP